MRARIPAFFRVPVRVRDTRPLTPTPRRVRPRHRRPDRSNSQTRRPPPRLIARRSPRTRSRTADKLRGNNLAAPSQGCAGLTPQPEQKEAGGRERMIGTMRGAGGARRSRENMWVGGRAREAGREGEREKDDVFRTAVALARSTFHSPRLLSLSAPSPRVFFLYFPFIHRCMFKPGSPGRCVSSSHGLRWRCARLFFLRPPRRGPTARSPARSVSQPIAQIFARYWFPLFLYLRRPGRTPRAAREWRRGCRVIFRRRSGHCRSVSGLADEFMGILGIVGGSLVQLLKRRGSLVGNSKACAREARGDGEQTRGLWV